MSGGGGSKDQIVGYRYFLGIHMGLFRGPINELVEIRIGDRTAWTGVEAVTPIVPDGGAGSGTDYTAPGGGNIIPGFDMNLS